MHVVFVAERPSESRPLRANYGSSVATPFPVSPRSSSISFLSSCFCSPLYVFFSLVTANSVSHGRTLACTPSTALTSRSSSLPPAHFVLCKCFPLFLPPCSHGDYRNPKAKVTGLE